MADKPVSQMSDDDKARTLQGFVYDAQTVSREWRAQSWKDCAFLDGKQWTDAEEDEASDSGLELLVINRTFPIVNLILGSQAIQRTEITAKGRTQADNELSQVMSEAIAFVSDQCEGDYLVAQAFRDQVVPGFGCISPCYSPDPRQETITWKLRDWKEIFWDPFASPWFDPLHCRYVIHQRWIDLDDLIALFPNKKRDIREQFNELTGSVKSDFGYHEIDEATYVEEEKRTLGATEWGDKLRNRVRPAEVWYTEYQAALFARFPDGRVIEIDDNMHPSSQLAIVQQAYEIVQANVKRMRVATVLGDLLLQDVRSPYPHDKFPFVPFIGYLDRWQFPYGVPRQIRGQDIEVNKRRSMALALLKNRRVIVESDVVESTEDMAALHREVNKVDGFIIVKPNAMQKIAIQDQVRLAPEQVALLEQSEREIQEISGANAEQMGYQGQSISGTAIERRQQQAATVTASLFDNLRRSLHKLGEQTLSLIQATWTAPKVLRITDRLSGAEKFQVLNEPVMTPDGQITFRNNITQGRYDIVVSEQPATDTVRERNLILLEETMKKCPPEVVPVLLNMAFEISDLPNKEELLARMRPLLGIQPGTENLSAEELKAQALQEIEAQKQAQQQQSQMDMQRMQLELEGMKLSNDKILAEIQKLMAEVQGRQAGAIKDLSGVQMDAFKEGVEIAKLAHPQQPQQGSIGANRQGQGGQRQPDLN